MRHTLFDLTTFGGIWFWAYLLAFWIGAATRTYGVSNGLLRQAARDARDAALFDRLARRNIRSASARRAKWPMLRAMSLGLVSAVAATMAIRFDSAFGQGMLAIMIPAILTSLVLDRRLQEVAEAPAPALWAAFDEARRLKIIAAVVSIAAAAAMGVARSVFFRLGI